MTENIIDLIYEMIHQNEWDIYYDILKNAPIKYGIKCDLFGFNIHLCYWSDYYYQIGFNIFDTNQNSIDVYLTAKKNNDIEYFYLNEDKSYLLKNNIPYYLKIIEICEIIKYKLNSLEDNKKFFAKKRINNNTDILNTFLTVYNRNNKLKELLK